MRISDWSSDVCSSDLVPGKALALLLWLPLLWPSRGLPGQGEAELVVLDVGQGLSVLVRTARHGLLYDMGPAQPAGFDAGERVGVPSLRALGVRSSEYRRVGEGCVRTCRSRLVPYP